MNSVGNLNEINNIKTITPFNDKNNRNEWSSEIVMKSLSAVYRTCIIVFTSWTWIRRNVFLRWDVVSRYIVVLSGLQGRLRGYASDLLSDQPRRPERLLTSSGKIRATGPRGGGKWKKKWMPLAYKVCLAGSVVDFDNNHRVRPLPSQQPSEPASGLWRSSATSDFRLHVYIGNPQRTYKCLNTYIYYTDVCAANLVPQYTKTLMYRVNTA